MDYIEWNRTGPSFNGQSDRYRTTGADILFDMIRYYYITHRYSYTSPGSDSLLLLISQHLSKSLSFIDFFFSSSSYFRVYMAGDVMDITPAVIVHSALIIICA